MNAETGGADRPALALVPTNGAAPPGAFTPVWSMRSRVELEAEVEAHLAEYIRVGLALRELRDRRLYEELGCDDFTEYCQSKNWGFSHNRAYQLIEAAEVAGALTIVKAPAPANEGQARALVPLRDDPEVLEAVWAEVTEGATPEAPITAARIRQVVRRYRPVASGGRGRRAGPDDPGVDGFYGAERRAFRDAYGRILAHLAFLQREAPTLERRFRRRALQPSELEDVGRLVAFLQAAVDGLDAARKHRLPAPGGEQPAGEEAPADVG